jgi:hypothetical protein
MVSLTLNEIADRSAIYNERLAIVLGLLTLTLAAASFISCRSCLSRLKYLRLPDPTKIKGYSSFYKYHLYYWWAFGVFLVSHVLVAIAHTGLPQAGDPDAGAHWTILGLGFFSALSSSVVFCSCRVLPRLAALVSPGSLFNNTAYKFLFRYHAYFWIIFFLLAFSHFAAGYHHAGIWPGS